MRRFISFLCVWGWIVALSASEGVVKDYKDSTEFSATGTKWYVRHHYGGPMAYVPIVDDVYCYYLEADTLIDGHIWKKLYKEQEGDSSSKRDTIYLGCVRESDGEVWVYPENLVGEFLYEKKVPFMLYDFSLQKGDTIYCSTTMGYFHTPVETSYGHYYTEVVQDVRIEHGRKVVDFGFHQWIEGIGDNLSPFFDQWKLMPTNGSIDAEEPLQVVTNEGKLIYFQREIFPVEEQIGWLRDGMTWHEYKSYEDGNMGTIFKTSLTRGEYQGRFNVWSDLNTPFCSFQEVNGKVYGIMSGYREVVICYDFSLQEGETVKLLKLYDFMRHGMYDQCTVSKVDSVEIDGIRRKRITLTGDHEDVWIEGIGSLKRVFPIDHLYNESYPVSYLTCCHDGEQMRYLHPDYVDCSTSKAADIESWHVSYADNVSVKVVGQTIACISPNAVKLEVYTMDAVKVGEAAFANGGAAVNVGKTPATYLYVVTFPNGRRESGKAVVGN